MKKLEFRIMINKISNYKFKNKKLLQQAFTHSSYSKENYERLEFLGDGILDFVVGEYLFKNTDGQEGSLTKLRAQFVSSKYLTKVFDRLKIEKHVLVGKSYQGTISSSIKADIVESIIAAVYLDSDYKAVKKFIYSIINLGNYKTMKSNDYKSQLQELIQAKKQKLSYKLLSKTGASHSPTYEMAVFINGMQRTKAVAKSKHEAEQKAAKLALSKLK